MRKGFTLLEIIIVITILGIMATFIVFTNVTASLRSGRDSKRKQDLSKLTSVLEDYYNDNYRYPLSGAGGTMDGIAWGGSFSLYVDRLPLDPKSPTQEYFYQTDASRNYYAIFAKLENNQDSDIEKVDCQSGCGPGLVYNYVVHSTNVVMLAGVPQVPGSGGEVVPTPTDVPLATATPTQIPSPTPTISIQSVSVQISSSSNDGEEVVSSGGVDLTSSDLELVTDGSNLQTVGLRFTNVNIPQSAVITSAYLEFQVDEVQSELTSLIFYGQATDNATTFSTASYNISGRTKTSANVTWTNIPAWNTIGEIKQTPTISSIISEIINRPGWALGNSLVIIITGSGHRTADSYNGSSSGAPRLIVTYY